MHEQSEPDEYEGSNKGGVDRFWGIDRYAQTGGRRKGGGARALKWSMGTLSGSFAVGNKQVARAMK